MSSITAVPLRPIAKGSLGKLWFGVVLAAVAGVGLAFAGSSQFGTTDSGLKYQVIEKGTGPTPTHEDFALVGYKGSLSDGTVFDQNERAPMEIGNVVPGFAEALTMMHKGGHMRVWIPANLAYGATPPQGSGIPANAPLQFDITLHEFKSRAEVMQLQQQMQLQQMMQGGGAPGGAPQGAAPTGEAPTAP
ncbi:FKBP-type peptidyl-prolyl cis-trans isomerase [Sphingobium sufflavum]|uniref:FKBP-type peptidyl-prolyl cis-trans isomerase n=1 Tax=Sphingobium sufflavum TaxID=1129547 RepID=UPI001F1BA9E4|nr:FKBP-type peptidyl-prolyl cis-trans isomerase [Sphingobium sufflavum]MCE7798802.1 FKBP-type peptidyl-prolyl cis-trans isomerase [Sphingobium sufflavum]